MQGKCILYGKGLSAKPNMEIWKPYPTNSESDKITATNEYSERRCYRKVACTTEAALPLPPHQGHSISKDAFRKAVHTVATKLDAASSLNSSPVY